ncbi:MAG: hypothetical protein H6Q07_1951 [Acidobacteria bacterium]|nr:hypothetical protein [Acidobacteriota bacterium]
MPGHKARNAGLLVGIVAAGILLWAPLTHLSFAIRLGSSLQKLASGAKEPDLAVVETKAFRRNGTQGYEALCYRPTGSPAASAVVLAAGISELGCYHPRLVALGRALADKGMLVITPDIREFREFRISAESIDQMLFWYSQVPTMEGAENVQKVGLAGISFAGTLALMAAAKPEIRDSVGFALGIGSYYDLMRCTKEWFAAEPADAGHNSYPTRFYAKWIVMRAALDMIKAPRDRLFLSEALNDLLLQKNIQAPPPDLTEEGLRWYTLATLRAGQSDEGLSLAILKYLQSRIFIKLDPEEALKKLRCPVFLIHGAQDDLIPPRESMELARRIEQSRLLISPFLTHTHPVDTPLSRWQKAEAAVDTLVFCYHLSQATM